MIFYGLVCAETEQTVELFLRREDAEEMLAEALSDEPDWTDTLSVECGSSSCPCDPPSP